MSDQEEGTESEEKDYAVEIAKLGRAACKKCKEKCLKDEMRLAKLVYNPFGAGKMKSWHHVECLFEAFLKQRPSTKRITSSDDIDGFSSLPSNLQNQLVNRIKKSNEDILKKYGDKAIIVEKKKSPKKEHSLNTSPTTSNATVVKESKPYPFKEFRKLIAQITNVNGYLEKTQIVSDLFKKGINGKKFEGDIHLWCKLLLPGVVKRIYNLQSKQLVKIFSRILKTDQNKMLRHLEQGDIGETIQEFYESSSSKKPVKKSNLTVEEVDEFLEELSKLTKEEEQAAHFESIMSKCTSNDLKIIIRLIKHDLRMNAGAKHILEGVHPDAYEAYQSSRDLGAVLKKCLMSDGKPFTSIKGVSAGITLMTPVLPMLAEACKSVEMAMKKCPNGFYSEIKYDGERVQVHKQGSDFKYFSRSLKPVLQHKIAHFKDYIPQAFPTGNDLILDSEILMIDKETQAPLPFGSLGKHKKTEYENACVCLYVFDCIYYNGEDLSKKPIQHRKKILKENMTEVKNHVVFSESKIIHNPSDLREMMVKVFQLGLEGLVLKDLQSVYEPGKRHWLKVKKDYLFDGAMADTADLIVLGAWYGTGKKGGKMSVFLMGCYDQKKDKFCTVTKVHTGIDDEKLEELQEQLTMTKISANPDKTPDWLSCNRPMVPDFVAKDPKRQPIWEITGAEFTQHHVHTANGISIRFPRVTKFRHDKNWKTATSLEELKNLFEKSKENTDFTLLMKDSKNGNLEKSDFEMDIASTSSNTSTTPRSRKEDMNSDTSKISPSTSSNTSTTPRSRKEDMNSDTSKISPSTSSNTSSTPRSKKGKDKDMNSDTNKTSPSTSSSVKEKSKRKRKHSDSEEFSPHSKKHYSQMYFTKVSLFLEEEVKHSFKDLMDNFCDCGGTILNENEIDKVTHVLHLNKFVKNIDRRYPCNARHVTLNWIEDSIKYECLQDVRLYMVKWRTDL